MPPSRCTADAFFLTAPLRSSTDFTDRLVKPSKRSVMGRNYILEAAAFPPESPIYVHAIHHHPSDRKRDPQGFHRLDASGPDFHLFQSSGNPPDPQIRERGDRIHTGAECGHPGRYLEL